jgi:hypothetical protein
MNADVNDAERRVHQSRLLFEDMGRLMRTELERFEREKVEDFKSGVETFLESAVEAQKEVCLVIASTIAKYISVLTLDYSSSNYGKPSSSSSTATKMALPSYPQAYTPTSLHPRLHPNKATQRPARTVLKSARTPLLTTAMARTALKSQRMPV